MTFTSIDAAWWPYLFILLAGSLATNLWRYIGVMLGGRIGEDSEALVMVRTLATALVAGVIANLIVFPSGALADAPLWLRVDASLAGFGTYLAFGKRMLAGIIVGEVILVGGMLLA
ncbi:MAG: branched-chain amino acid transport [Mesorhizobium amorphae]|nr:MAG: branched-chain amino acid transport [Mesorhizobium amorphae]